MTYRHTELFNVAETECWKGGGGIVLQRYPRRIRDRLGTEKNRSGRIKSRSAAGCEIRFVTSSESVLVTLAGVDADAYVSVYNGDFHHSTHRIPMGVATTLRLTKPDAARVRPELFQKRRFFHDVWRLFVERGPSPDALYSIELLDIDALGNEIRPPRADEVPSVRWLAYGSSITHGSGASFHHNCYVQYAAQKLGVDVLNMAIGGACLCEPELADYFASREWDFATLELGVNMRELFSAEEFERRARYMIRRLSESRPEAPIFLIDIYPNGDDYAADPDAPRAVANNRFRQILWEIYQQAAGPNLHFLKGSGILTEIDHLDYDLIHPFDHGHFSMGYHLAQKLDGILRNTALRLPTARFRNVEASEEEKL